MLNAYLLYTLYILHTHIYAKFPVTAYIKSFKAFCCDKFDLLKNRLICKCMQYCAKMFLPFRMSAHEM